VRRLARRGKGKVRLNYSVFVLIVPGIIEPGPRRDMVIVAAQAMHTRLMTIAPLFHEKAEWIGGKPSVLMMEAAA